MQYAKTCDILFTNTCSVEHPGAIRAVHIISREGKAAMVETITINANKAAVESDTAQVNEYGAELSRLLHNMRLTEKEKLLVDILGIIATQHRV